MKPPLKAALFDLDGTLLNTLKDLANATNRALASAGYPVHPVEAYRHFVGNGLRTLVIRALPAGEDTSPALDELVKRTGENYARGWAETTRPYPHIPELLDELRGKGIPMAVVTNKPHDWTLLMLERYFPGKPFAFVQGATADLPHKPDPTGALKTAHNLKVMPEEAAFLGDSNVDMYTARNAHMLALGAAWGFRGAEELKAAGADHILKDPLDMLPFF